MKNPFEKKDDTVIILTSFAGALIAGAFAYLYLTASGAAARKSIKGLLKKEGKDVAAGLVAKKTGIRKKTVKKVADHAIK